MAIAPTGWKRSATCNTRADRAETVDCPDSRLEENIGAAAVELSARDFAGIELALASIKVEGDRYPPHLQQRVGR